MTLPRRLAAQDHLSMPWKNGRGTTYQVAIFPEDARFPHDSYLWRVSYDPVPEGGPFSSFPGYDRTICILEGPAMILDHGLHGRQSVETPLKPLYFSGDWNTRAELPGGAIRDFNVIVKRGECRSSFVAHQIQSKEIHTCEPTGKMSLLFCVSGELKINRTSEILVRNDALIFDEPEKIMALKTSQFLLVSIR